MWVDGQRQQKKHGRVSPEYVKRFDALGFEWNPQTAAWEEMFARLVQYKAQYRHCNVPAKWPEDLQLGRYVYVQRYLKKQGRLIPDRGRRLDEIGFEWRTSRGSRRSAR